MVLTKKQAEQLKSGKLTEKNFLKVLKNGTHDFDKYLLMYCKPIDDYSIESLNMRVRVFKEFNYEISITYVLGECTEISYKKDYPF